MKYLFDCVRNLTMCALLLAAGVYAINYSGVSVFGSFFQDAPGWTVIMLAAVLAVLNLWDWILMLRSLKLHLLWVTLATLLYVLVSVRIIELILAMRLAL